jgi:hypothetical protein
MKTLIPAILLAAVFSSCNKTPDSICNSVASVSGCYVVPDSGAYACHYMAHPSNSQKVNVKKWLPFKSFDLPVSTSSPDGSFYYVSSSENESIYEINSSSGEVDKIFYTGNEHGSTFIYHMRQVPKILVVKMDVDKVFHVREIDINSGDVQDICTVDVDAYPMMRSMMLDEKHMFLYFVNDAMELVKIELPSGTKSKICDVCSGDNHWFFDADDEKIYYMSREGLPCFALYEVDLKSKVPSKLKEFPLIGITVLGGSAYDELENQLVLYEPGQKLLVNINTKSLNIYSEHCDQYLTNLSFTKPCYKKDPLQ